MQGYLIVLVAVWFPEEFGISFNPETPAGFDKHHRKWRVKGGIVVFCAKHVSPLEAYMEQF